MSSHAYAKETAMSEQEMLQEIERLRRELADMTKSRDRLREMIYAIVPLDSPDVTEELILEMMQQPAQGIDDIIADLRSSTP
jgi:hypothetical protein